MLDRTFSITRTVTPALHYNQFQIPFPTSDERFLRSQQLRDPRQSVQAENDVDADIGIGAINVKVFSLWNDVLQYVFRSPPKSTAPPVSITGLFVSRPQLRFRLQFVSSSALHSLQPFPISGHLLPFAPETC
jgi:hypothetical protein